MADISGTFFGGSISGKNSTHIHSHGTSIPFYSLYTDLPSTNIVSGSEVFVERLTSAGSVGPYYLKFFNGSWKPIYVANDLEWIISNPIPQASELSLLTNFTYIIPGGFGFNYDGAPLDTPTSFRLPLKPTFNTNWNSVEIGYMTNGNSVTINRMYIARGNDNEYTEITENQETGYITCLSADTIVSGGTTQTPKITWLGSWDLASNNTQQLMIAIQLDVGAYMTSWGQNHNIFLGLGFAQKGNEKLNNNLTDTFDIAGSYAFNSLPNIVVKFKETTPVINLPFVGDSHTYGYGDNEQVANPYGIAGHINEQYNISGVKIVPLNVGRIGHTTTQFNDTLQTLTTYFDFRAFALQFGSINNVSQDITYSQISADFENAKNNIIGNQRFVFPYFAGGADNIPEHSNWWEPYKNMRDWCLSTYPHTISGINERVVNQVTGEFIDGYGYVDGAHLITSGYAVWSEDIATDIIALLESRTGTSLT